MKKLFTVLLTLVFTSVILTFTVSADAAPQPVVSFSQKDGYTIVTVTPKKNTTVRYTTNGSKPTAKSKKISGKLTIKKSCTLRLRVSKKGATTKTYRYQVEVINKKLSDFANKLNNTELHPVKTGTYIDKEVDKILKKIIKNDMTTYEKLGAIYDWITKNIKYKVSGIPIMISPDLGGYKEPYDYLIVEQAKFALDNRFGVCDDYSSLFIVMCRAVGIPAYRVDGMCKTVSGGYTGHAWALIAIDDEDETMAFFDAMLDSKNKSGRRYFERDIETDLYKGITAYYFGDFEKR